MKLSAKERSILSDFFESEAYKILRDKFIEGERLEIAKRCLGLDPRDGHTLSRLQGQADSLKQMHLYLKEINKSERKKNGGD